MLLTDGTLVHQVCDLLRQGIFTTRRELQQQLSALDPSLRLLCNVRPGPPGFRRRAVVVGDTRVREPAYASCVVGYRDWCEPVDCNPEHWEPAE